MRQYKQMPPVLNPNPAPQISGTSGLGTGGGAGVQTPDGSGWGNVIVKMGRNPSTGGSVSLTFSSVPPAMFVSGPEEMGTVTQSLLGSVLTILWTAKPPANSTCVLSYEWNVSQ